MKKNKEGLGCALLFAFEPKFAFALKNIKFE